MTQPSKEFLEHATSRALMFVREMQKENGLPPVLTEQQMSVAKILAGVYMAAVEEEREGKVPR